MTSYIDLCSICSNLLCFSKGFDAQRDALILRQPSKVIASGKVPSYSCVVSFFEHPVMWATYESGQSKPNLKVWTYRHKTHEISKKDASIAEGVKQILCCAYTAVGNNLLAAANNGTLYVFILYYGIVMN